MGRHSLGLAVPPRCREGLAALCRTSLEQLGGRPTPEEGCPLPRMGQQGRVLSKNLVASVSLRAVFEHCETLWGLAYTSSVEFTESLDLKLFLS